MVSPERKRTAALHFCRRAMAWGERRACAAIRQPRSTQLYGGQRLDKDAVLAAQLRRISRERPRAGYRMATVQMRRAGMMVNAKRMLRFWRQEGLEGAAPATARPQREGHAAKEGDTGQ